MQCKMILCCVVLCSLLLCCVFAVVTCSRFDLVSCSVTHLHQASQIAFYPSYTSLKSTQPNAQAISLPLPCPILPCPCITPLACFCTSHHALLTPLSPPLQLSYPLRFRTLPLPVPPSLSHRHRVLHQALSIHSERVSDNLRTLQRRGFFDGKSQSE
jgi:hypothetical protein